MKKDIQNKADIKLLIDSFYLKVRQDDLIGHVFNEIAQVDWEHHLPVMYSFWEFLLLNNPDAYRGNPIQKHVALHAIHPLKPEYFDRWLALFQATVDDCFEGVVADQAKFRAMTIAETWKPKFSGPHSL